MQSLGGKKYCEGMLTCWLVQLVRINGCVDQCLKRTFIMQGLPKPPSGTMPFAFSCIIVLLPTELAMYDERSHMPIRLSFPNNLHIIDHVERGWFFVCLPHVVRQQGKRSTTTAATFLRLFLALIVDLQQL